jgi:hypothetical protein
MSAVSPAQLAAASWKRPTQLVARVVEEVPDKLHVREICSQIRQPRRSPSASHGPGEALPRVPRQLR